MAFSSDFDLYCNFRLSEKEMVFGQNRVGTKLVSIEMHLIESVCRIA